MEPKGVEEPPHIGTEVATDPRVGNALARDIYSSMAWHPDVKNWSASRMEVVCRNQSQYHDSITALKVSETLVLKAPDQCCVVLQLMKVSVGTLFWKMNWFKMVL